MIIDFSLTSKHQQKNLASEYSQLAIADILLELSTMV